MHGDNEYYQRLSQRGGSMAINSLGLVWSTQRHFYVLKVFNCPSMAVTTIMWCVRVFIRIYVYIYIHNVCVALIGIC